MKSVWLTFLAPVLLTLSVSVHAGQSETKSYPVLSGVGIALKSTDGQLFVGKVIEGSPADESGRVCEGARLLSVRSEGTTTDLKDKSIGEAASVIRGPVGTDVVLTFVLPDDDAETSLTLTRAPLELSGVPNATYRAFIGKAVPDLELSSLDGKSKLNLSDQLGKVIVLDFWASWCPTCYGPVAEMQMLAKENPDWRGKVELITVTVDSNLAQASETITKQGWSETKNLAAELDELNTIGVSVIPVVIIIDTEGKVATMAESHSIDVEKEVTTLLTH